MAGPVQHGEAFHHELGPSALQSPVRHIQPELLHGIPVLDDAMLDGHERGPRLQSRSSRHGGRVPNRGADLARESGLDEGGPAVDDQGGPGKVVHAAQPGFCGSGSATCNSTRHDWPSFILETACQASKPNGASAGLRCRLHFEPRDAPARAALSFKRCMIQAGASMLTRGSPLGAVTVAQDSIASLQPSVTG